MKNISKSIIAIVSIAVASVVFYWNRNEYILSKWLWKYSGGYYVSDFIPGSKDNTIKGGVLYLGNKPHCKVIFCFYDILVIQGLNNEDYGFYKSKGGDGEF